MLDRMIPGRVKSNVRASLEELHDLAHAEISRQNLPCRTAALWESMCDSTFEIMAQLLINNTDKRMEWGLRGKRHRFNQTRLAVMYWWFLMYQFVLFRHKGIDGFSKDDELPELHRASEKFIEHLAAPTNLNFQVPGPWEERWSSQVSLEASLGLYNRLMEMIGMRVDLDQRVQKVSLFTTASENIYDSTIRKKLSNGRWVN